MRRLPAARTGTWAPRHRRGLGEYGREAGGRCGRGLGTGWAEDNEAGSPSRFLERRRLGPGVLFGGTLHAEGGFEEAYGVTPRRAGSFLTCAGIRLSVAGSQCDGAPGGAPGRAVSALVRARALVRVCVCVCARVCGEADPGIRVTPPDRTSLRPRAPRSARLPDAERRGGHGPFKGQPALRVMDTSASAPRPLERGRELVFIHNFFLFLPLRQLFIQRSRLGAQRARSSAGRAVWRRCGAARPRASARP